jgi:single-strand DNA-binding protein
MGSLNRVILAGRLTADPEIRYTTNELPVARFTLAINKRLRNGEDQTEFVNCTAWRGLAKICGEYLKKGKLVAVEGRLRISKYDGKDGIRRTAVEVVTDNMQMLDGKFHKAASKASSDKGSGSDEIEIIEPSKPVAKKKAK